MFAETGPFATVAAIGSGAPGRAAWGDSTKANDAAAEIAGNTYDWLGRSIEEHFQSQLESRETVQKIGAGVGTVPIQLRPARVLPQIILWYLMSAALVTAPFWGGQTDDRFGEEAYWGWHFGVGYICAAVSTVFATRLLWRLAFGGREGLFERNGRLVFLEAWIWSQRLSEIESVAVVDRQSQFGTLPSLEFTLISGRKRHVPVGLLTGGPARSVNAFERYSVASDRG